MRRCRIYDKVLKIIRDVKYIDFENEEVMFYADDYKEDGYYPNLDIVRSFNEVNIMWSTGMKDKNGVDIYEGDICQFLIGSYKTRLGIRWSYSTLKWIGDCEQESFNLSDFSSKGIEVIGNIYEDQARKVISR